MALQTDLIKRLGATYVRKCVAGVDPWATVANAAGGLRLQCEEGSYVKSMTEWVPNNDERGLPSDYVPPTAGKTTGESKLISQLRAPLIKNIVATTPSLVLPQDHVFETIFGGKHVAGGTTIIGVPTINTVPVTAGQAARLPKGSIGAFPVAGVWYRRRVIDCDTGTDILTIYPDLPGAPTVGGIVHNCWTYYQSWKNTNSLYTGHAQADDLTTAWDFENFGGTGEIEIDLTPGKNVKWTATLKSAFARGPGDYGLSTADVALVETDGFFNAGALTVFRELSGATTAVHSPLQKIVVKYMPGNHLKEETGGVQGFTGVARNPQRPSATVEITEEPDAQRFADYVSRKKFMLWYELTMGPAGAAQNGLVLDFPTLCIPSHPDLEAEIEGARHGVYTFATMLDSTVLTPATDLARATYRIALD